MALLQYFNRVNCLFVVLLCAAGLAGQPSASQKVKAAGPKIQSTAPADDPVAKEYEKLLESDDAAQEEVDRWIKENQAFQEKGAGLYEVSLNLRIEQRLQPVRKAYEDFLLRHPDHARARLAYGSFLDDRGLETEAVVQWERARQLDPKNPAAWNNLANYYGHRGPVTNAFVYYAKAIELNPSEPLYYQNFATTIYLFRQDAMAMYGLDEQKVFDRALELYRQALRLDPDNFVLANDLAQSYYGIKPARTADALRAWEYALKTAQDELQREGVYVHLARNEIIANRFDDARQHLASVTNQTYGVLRERLLKNLAAKENQTKTNTIPTAPTTPVIK